MLLGFHPQITIVNDWQPLIRLVSDIADQWVKSGRFLEHLIYQEGASQVATLPEGGWISKSAPSENFFVFGGIDATETIGERWKKRFPSLSFTPSSMGFSEGHVPIHRDSPKNGKTSLIYPLFDNPSLGRVFDPVGVKDFYYLCQKEKMTAINITEPHTVYVHEPRIWYTIHCHEPIEEVKKVFDQAGVVEL